ncbi:hypothetical protein RRF57_009839 [Xylaria bambusicola]|uniref:Uncharacterized protein n=1 Tax=Xylaria bambusicola TaxID=326684 RepID=A0AAN7UKA7_9PEZI
MSRNAPIRAVFKEQAAVDLTFIQISLLIARVHNVGGARGLLQDADLVLAAAGVIIGQRRGNGLERLITLGVVYLQGTIVTHNAQLHRVEGNRAQKSTLMAKFCHAVSSMAVDQTSVFCRLSTLKVFLFPDLPINVPVWKLNWLAL